MSPTPRECSCGRLAESTSAGVVMASHLVAHFLDRTQHFSLSAAEAAKLLRVDVTRVRQRLRERSLYGLEYEGTWRLPRLQFERRLVIPGLAQVLKALPPDLFPLDVVDWFLLPEPELQLESDAAPLSPRAWLLSGRPIDAVVKVARDLTRT
jgi:hypothetical protein